MGFALSWNPCCKDTKLRVIIFSAFWQPEKAILPSREINVSNVPSYVGATFPHLSSFVWANYPHFVCLKMRFLPIRETNVSWYLAKSGDILIIFLIFFIFPRGETTFQAWHGFAWFSFDWLGLAWLGLAWLGMAWLGLAWLSSAPSIPLGLLDPLRCNR